MTVAVETYILKAVVEMGSEITDTVLETSKIIGNITYVWLVMFAYISYMLLGIWYHSEKDETSLDMSTVKAFLKKAKETSLVNIYVTMIALILVSSPYIFNGRKDIVPFIITYILFAFISHGIVSNQCVSLITKEINKRVSDSNTEKKDSDELNEKTASN